MKRIILTVFLISSVLQWGCNGNNSNGQHDEPIKVKVGMIPITDCAQLYVAKSLQFFQKEGLEVELVPIAGGAKILQTLASGDIDVGFSNLASVVFFEQNFEPLIGLKGGTLMNQEYSEGGLVYREEDAISSIQDVGGKTIAVNTLNNIVHLAVVRVLKKNGISPDDVTFVEMKFGDMPAALRSGRIDIATLPEPLLSMNLNEGGVKSLGDHFVMAFGEMYSTGYFTTSQKYSENSELFTKFNTAIEKATKKANLFDSEVIKAIFENTEVPEETIKNSGRALFITDLPSSAIPDMKSWLIEESFLQE